MTKTLPPKPAAAEERDTGKLIETKVNSIMESMSFIFLIFIVTYFVLIVPSLVRMYDFLKERNVIVNFSEYLWTPVGVLLSHLLHRFSATTLIRAWRPYIATTVVRANETPEKRMQRLGGYISSTIYYAISWLSLMALTRGTMFCPPEFGGHLDITKSLAIWPYEVSFSIRLFYMLTLGHHIERLIHEVVNNRKTTSFNTMTFHHVLTIMLIFLSFYCRHLMFGIPVLLTHDFNDIFLESARFLRESKFQSLASVAFLTMMVSWFYTRIWIYSRHILYGLVYNALNLTEFTRQFLFMQVFFIPALVGLFVLNSFWFFQISRVFVWRFVKKDKCLPMEDYKNKKQ